MHRQGSSKREMPPALLARLFQQRSQARLLRFDEQAVPETDLSSLTPKLFGRFILASEEPPNARLLKRGIMARDELGAERCSVAGLLMCSETSERWLPNAFIQTVRYRGVKQDSDRQLDARDICGPLDLQVGEALAFVRRNMSIFARKTPSRVDTPQFSMRAVFEAVVNAVAHRDYSVHGSKIRLFVFDDRLELYSPGALPNTLSVDTMALRQATRNELLTSLLAKCSVEDPSGELGRGFLMDKRGDGVPIILEESERTSGRRPEYRLLDDAELLLTIWAAMPPTD